MDRKVWFGIYCQFDEGLASTIYRWIYSATQIERSFQNAL